MTIIKAFLCVFAIVTIIFLLIKGEKDKKTEARTTYMTSENVGTIEKDMINERKKDYISFHLVSDTVSKVWEFELRNNLTIIGRAIENFHSVPSIQNDLHFSRQHLAFHRDKNGVVNFMALQGDKNPVFILNGNRVKAETGHFTLSPGTHTLRMGETIFEVHFKGEQAEATNSSGTKVFSNINNRTTNVYSRNIEKTRIWGI